MAKKGKSRTNKHKRSASRHMKLTVSDLVYPASHPNPSGRAKLRHPGKAR